MARKTDAVADFFAAADALTYKEMLDVAGLIGLQLGERLQREIPAECVAGALIDAADSHADSGDN
jgi:hypothetical protein